MTVATKTRELRHVVAKVDGGFVPLAERDAARELAGAARMLVHVCGPLDSDVARGAFRGLLAALEGYDRAAANGNGRGGG